MSKGSLIAGLLVATYLLMAGSTSYRLTGLLVFPLLPLVTVPEVEHVEQVPDRGDVGRYVG